MAADIVVGTGAHGGFAEFPEQIGEEVEGGDPAVSSRGVYTEAWCVGASQEDHVEGLAHVHRGDRKGDATAGCFLVARSLVLLLRWSTVNGDLVDEAGRINEVEAHNLAVIGGGGPRLCGRRRRRLPRAERSEKDKKAGWSSHAEY